MTYEAWDRRTVAALCLVAIATVAVSAWAELLVARLVIAFDWFVLDAGLVFVGWLGRWVALAMPARTRSGALVVAMLKAYRRSLEKTLGVAESVWDVIGVRELAWFETPDRMIVWAMALDLERDLAAMFARANDAPSGEPWFPDWYGTTVTEPGRMFRSLDQLVPRSAARSLLSRR